MFYKKLETIVDALLISTLNAEYFFRCNTVLFTITDKNAKIIILKMNSKKSSSSSSSGGNNTIKHNLQQQPFRNDELKNSTASYDSVPSVDSNISQTLRHDANTYHQYHQYRPRMDSSHTSKSPNKTINSRTNHNDNNLIQNSNTFQPKRNKKGAHNNTKSPHHKGSGKGRGGGGRDSARTKTKNKSIIGGDNNNYNNKARNNIDDHKKKILKHGKDQQCDHNNNNNNNNNNDHNIDINMFEQEVFMFQERMDSIRNGITDELDPSFAINIGANSNIDIVSIFLNIINCMESLAMKLKEKSYSVELNQSQKLKQQKQQHDLKVIDRSLYCLIQGVECLDLHLSYHLHNNETVQNENNELIQEGNQNLSIPFDDMLHRILKIWTCACEVIHTVANKSSNLKKRIEFDHIYDCFMISLRHLEKNIHIENRFHDTIKPYSNNKIQTEKLQILGQCLQYIIQGFGNDLHSENAISPMFQVMLLPLLEMEGKAEILKLQKIATKCIIEVFRWKQHSSAILAPVIVDAISTGEETIKPNLIRLRLLRSLITLLLDEDYIERDCTDFLCCICQCLYTSLDKIYAIELSHKHKKNTEKNKLIVDHIEVAGVFKWIHKLQQSNEIRKNHENEKSLQWHTLRLLSSMTKLYPQACAQYWALFFPQTVSSSRKISKATVTLLSIITESEESMSAKSEKIMAVKAAREFLSSLPIDLWSRSGYLKNRVETSLSLFIKCCCDELKMSQSKEYSNELCITAQYLITEIPYEIYNELIEAGIQLIHQVGQCYISNENSNGDNLSTFLKLLPDCFGGIETPKGDFTSLPRPTEQWLRQPISALFIEEVFRNILFSSDSDINTKGSVITMKVELVTRMVRTVSWIVLENEERLRSFVSLSQLLATSDSIHLKLSGVKLIRAFIEGKQKAKILPVNSKTGSVSMHLIYQILQQMLQEQDNSIRSCTLTTYGHLQYSDWFVLLYQNPNPIESMLPLCLEYSSDVDTSIRSEACRSIGNIITECLESISSIYHDELRSKILAIAESTMIVAASAVEDSSAAVRSMALFAIGNIAYTTSKMKDIEELLIKLPIFNISELTFRRLTDKNDKVVGNAIRTLGHLCNLLYRPSSDLCTASYNNHLSIQFCGNAALELSRKINLALDDVTDSLNQRSWRQRSFAKRHAWGSSQALASIVCNKFALECTNRHGIQSALNAMIRCIRYCHLVNEKIVSGSIATLSSVPIENYCSQNNFDSTCGKALAVCLMALGSAKVSVAHKGSIADLMKYLLRGMNHFDVISCLNHQDLSQSNVQELYNWMVTTNMTAILFDKVAEALQLCQFSSDVSLLQKFKSRAEMKRRYEMSTNKSVQNELQLHDDDEDEL